MNTPTAQPVSLEANLGAARVPIPGGTAISSDDIHLLLKSAVAEMRTFADFVQRMNLIIRDHSDCLAIWLATPGESGVEFRPLFEASPGHLWTAVGPRIRASVESAPANELAFERIAGKTTLGICPIPLQQMGHVTLAVCFSNETESETRQHWLLTLVYQAFQLWRNNRDQELSRAALQQTQHWLSLVSAIGESSNDDELAISLANGLKRLFTGRAVFIAFQFGGTASNLRLTAISDLEMFDADSTVARAVENGLLEFGARQQAFWADATNSPDWELLLREYDAESALVIPFWSNEGVIGQAVVVTGTASEGQAGDALLELAERTRSLITPLVVDKRHSEISLTRLLKRRIAKRLPSSTRKKWAIVALGILGIALMPWPFNVKCDVRLQPVSRRFVAAPFEGILDSTVAKNGDLVHAGDVLARLDGQTLRIEQSGLRAELNSAKKKADQARANRDIAEAQIQKSEMNRIQSQIDDIENKLQELEIRCPIDGIVISGDLDQVEGAKVKLGQSLFEVGPLDEMLVEVLISEDQVRFVDAGDSVQVKFNAYPFKNWNGTIHKVHPRAELVENKNVFVAEVVIPNADGTLQPGMRGRAKIYDRWSVASWVFLHRAWNDIRYWTVF
ncbi:MAG: efflux RND transporter periplasmic adaptor subunit [Pirellulaceae bacterium]